MQVRQLSSHYSCIIISKRRYRVSVYVHIQGHHTLYYLQFLQSITVTLVFTMAAQQLAHSCPLPAETCSPALPTDTSYNNYLNNLTVSDYAISLNLTRQDVSFAPQVITKTYIERGEQANINEGCSTRDFNFTDLGDANIPTPLKLRCPHTFRCDYNPQRIPAHIYHAHCLSHELSDGTKCREVFYPVVTVTTESCDPLKEGDREAWLLKTEKVAVSCIAIM